MKRRKFPKKIVRCFWLFVAVLLVFSFVRLRPLLLVHAAETKNGSLAWLALKIGVNPNTMTSGDVDDVLNNLAGSHQVGGVPRPVLVMAAINRAPDVVKLLLEAGADPNRGDGAMPPLIAATLGGDPECVRLLLLHGADPNGRYKDGSSALDSLSSPNPVIVAMLKHAGTRE